jgi:hypothetical protein
MTKRKNKVIIILTVAWILGFTVWNLWKPADAVSNTERRKLAQFPEVTAEKILSGDFMEAFEDYAMDQFPMRDVFLRLKAQASEMFLGQKDQHGIYVAQGHAVSMEYPLHTDSVAYAAGRFRYLYETYLKDTDVQIYGVIVPDKNYYLGEPSGHLTLDYEELYRSMYEQTDFIDYIEVRDLLSQDSYYRTDPHWRQECLTQVSARISTAMHAALSGEYEKNVLEEPFCGAYFGQTASALPGEELVYLTNDTLSQCKMYNYETDTETGIYDLQKAQGADPYEIYLSGSVSLLTIENPSADTDRELIIFRDSFGSSIAPLLAEGYAKTTLVDIRYIQSQRLGQFLDFKDQDILFLYSTSVLNHSSTLK